MDVDRYSDMYRKKEGKRDLFDELKSPSTQIFPGELFVGLTPRNSQRGSNLFYGVDYLSATSDFFNEQVEALYQAHVHLHSQQMDTSVAPKEGKEEEDKKEEEEETVEKMEDEEEAEEVEEEGDYTEQHADDDEDGGETAFGKDDGPIM